MWELCFGNRDDVIFTVAAIDEVFEVEYLRGRKTGHIPRHQYELSGSVILLLLSMPLIALSSSATVLLTSTLFSGGNSVL